MPLFIVLAVSLAACRAEQSAPQPDAQVHAAHQGDLPVAPPPDERGVELKSFTTMVPGTTVRLDMRLVPGGALDIDDDATPGARKRVDVGAFFLASTETTWDMYDAFVFALDKPETEQDPPDAWTRPSKPYILMDRGFGHSGYPAISVSYKGASEFCRWLSKKTGRAFRLPTEVEWEHACRAGTQSALISGSNATYLDEHAWFALNSESDMRITTHPVATKKPDELGLFDMLGNAAEWAVGSAGLGVARGGSFKEPADKVTASARRPNDKSLNKSDPQAPKSIWWLADGGFIGFRVACEANAPRSTPKRAEK